MMKSKVKNEIIEKIDAFEQSCYIRHIINPEAFMEVFSWIRRRLEEGDREPDAVWVLEADYGIYEPSRLIGVYSSEEELLAAMERKSYTELRHCNEGEIRGYSPKHRGRCIAERVLLDEEQI